MYGQLQQLLRGGYAPAPVVPGGVEVGAFGAQPRERGVQMGYFNIDGYPQIGAAFAPMGPMATMAVPQGAFAVPHPLQSAALAWQSAALAAGWKPPAYQSDPSASMARPSFVGGRQVTEWQPTMDRVLWLGFRFAGILSGANQAVSSQPQDTFSPRKVVVPGSVAPNFEIADLKIGAISQLSSSDPIPAEAFIPNASLTDVHFDTAKISQSVTFSVNNISNATATYRASMNGFVVR